MGKKTFYISNAVAWIVLVFLAVEPLSSIVTKPWQFVLTMAVEMFVLYLVFMSVAYTVTDK